MDLVQAQGQQLHHRDSLLLQGANTLWLPLYFEPLPIRSLSDTLTPNPYDIQTIRDNARRYITLHHADLYVGISNPAKLEKVEIETMDLPRALVRDRVEDELDRRHAVKNRLSPWRKELNLSLQLTQNFASDNWYQGSSNTFAMLGSAKGLLNYSKDKLVWSNILEWRAGASTVAGDTLRHINTTDDLFRLYSKAGYQVHPKIYTTFFAEFKTNFFQNWKLNQQFLSATFFTPIRYTMGAGIDYAPLNGLTINISPLTYKMVYALVSDSSIIDVTEFGIEEGKDIVNELGSSVRVLWCWKPVREIQLDADFYFYTNYHRVETELEVTCHFIINRFLSAKIMLHPRYDSSVEVKPGRKTNLQFKEFISVGFAHTFR